MQCKLCFVDNIATQTQFLLATLGYTNIAMEKKTSTLIGRSSTNGLFSIAMLVCWRVGPVKFPHSFGLPPVGQSWLRSSESGCWMTRFPNLHTAIAMYRCIHITHMYIYIYPYYTQLWSINYVYVYIIIFDDCVKYV